MTRTLPQGQRVKVVRYDPLDLKYGAINGQEGVITHVFPDLTEQFGMPLYEVTLDNFPGENPWAFYSDELEAI